MAKKRSYEDRKDYLISAVKKRRKKIKRMAVELAEAKYLLCGLSSTEAISGRARDIAL
jgi:hypothetical protein